VTPVAPESTVQRATRRYLVYGVPPAWFVPRNADWVMHRRTRIESNQRDA